jgi:inorganic pyrophosphatase
MSNLIVDTLIEIPQGSQNKYEFDKEKGRFVLDRVLYSSMRYPAEYGYLEGTLALDGDPLDVLVLVTNPTFPGCVINTRIIGVMLMVDNGEEDEKLIGVPTTDPRWSHVKSLDDVAPHTLKEIENFFLRYKDLENKKVEVTGFKDAAFAEQLYNECRKRYEEAQK